MQPAKRNDDAIYEHDLGDELLIYDQGRHQVHCLNPSTTLVWRRCDGRATPREIAAALDGQLGQAVDENFVLLAIDELRAANLLAEDDNLPQSQPIAGPGRRDMLVAAGLAALCLPGVISMAAPIPAAAFSF